MLLQQMEFPLGTVYNIEQFKVTLKSRVRDAEEQHGNFEKSNYRAVNRHSRDFKNGILKGRQRRRRSHSTQPRSRVKEMVTKAGGKGYTRLGILRTAIALSI